MGKKQEKKQSIMQMANGAFLERVDYEMERVVDNILDLNTDPKKVRKITVTIELKPDSDRSMIGVSVTAKSTLAPTNPVGTSLAFVNDVNGEAVLAEMTPQAPGQMFLDGSIQEEPKIIKLCGNGGK